MTGAIVLPKLVIAGLKVAGPLFTYGLQAAALDNARSIFKNKSTGDLSALPFVALFANCLVWSYYGFLANDQSVLYANGLGVVVGLISTVVFQMFTKKTPLVEYALALGAVGSATHFFLQSSSQQVGLLGNLLAVVMLASPLATFKTVVDSKSTESLPFITSLNSLGSALSWTLYGALVAHDPLVYTPSALGLIPVALQFGLYAKYGMPPSKKLKANMF